MNKEVRNILPKYPEYKTIIHRCVDCKMREECEGIQYKKQGYCHTFKKNK